MLLAIAINHQIKEKQYDRLRFFKLPLFVIYMLWFTPHDMLKAYSWLCTPELLLVVLRVPYSMLGIETKLDACKVIALPAVLPTGEPDPVWSILFYESTCFFRTSIWYLRTQLPCRHRL